MSDIRDTLPAGGDHNPTATSPTTYPPTTSSRGPSATSSPPTPAPGASSTDAASVAGTAKDEAAHVAGTAKDEAAHVATTVKEEAKEVGREARTQISHLYDEARHELASQAADRQDRLARGLRSAGGELRSMAESSTDGGVATDVVRQASQRLDGVASWLSARDPGAVLDEVKRYARRRPGMFLACAALAGVVVGRLTRSLAAGAPAGSGTARPPLTATAGTTVHETTDAPALRSTARGGTDAQASDDPRYRPGELG